MAGTLPVNQVLLVHQLVRGARVLLPACSSASDEPEARRVAASLASVCVCGFILRVMRFANWDFFFFHFASIY